MDFPILRLMRDDFISFYLMQGTGYPHPFKKLCFLFDFDNTVALRVFSLNKERKIMSPDENGIRLTTDTGYPMKNIQKPFKVGTMELIIKELESLIGAFDSPKPGFLYLRFEPSKESATSYIGYDIYFNAEKTIKAKLISAKKPSPPYGQD